MVLYEFLQDGGDAPTPVVLIALILGIAQAYATFTLIRAERLQLQEMRNSMAAHL